MLYFSEPLDSIQFDKIVEWMKKSFKLQKIEIIYKSLINKLNFLVLKHCFHLASITLHHLFKIRII